MTNLLSLCDTYPPSVLFSAKANVLTHIRTMSLKRPVILPKANVLTDTRPRATPPKRSIILPEANGLTHISLGQRPGYHAHLISAA
jgi:hypothetical protein